MLAEPASFTAEAVVQGVDAEGKVTSERVVPLLPGYMAADYIHSGQQILIREKK
jgi:hypothetical protein